MAADVSSLAMMLRGSKENDEKTGELVTMDLLGIGIGTDIDTADEVDLDLYVPVGFERRLDLLSGKTYLYKPQPTAPISGHLHDLNLPPPPPQPPSSAPLPDLSSGLDLKLFPSATAAPPPNHHSVCTLEKVKSALDRLARPLSPSSHSPSSSSSSAKRRSALSDAVDEAAAAAATVTARGEAVGSMVVGGCPVCLLYVLVTEVDPRCPKCEAHVPVQLDRKKARRIDLNF